MNSLSVNLTTGLSTLTDISPEGVRAIAQHFMDGALFVLISRGPEFHSIIDLSGEVWTSETPVLGVMIRYVALDEARDLFQAHCAVYGDEQRADILLHAYYPRRLAPSRN